MSIGRALYQDATTQASHEYRWPLFWPEIRKEEILEELSDTLSTRWIGQGPKVDKLESLFQSTFHTLLPPVAVNSCTSALHLSYILAGIRPGDKVISTVLTCTATNHALLQCGADILFCDIQQNTLNADPASIAQLIERHPGIRAVVVTHLGGLPCEIDQISNVLAYYYPVSKRPKLICDAAQALGAVYKSGNITHPSLEVFSTCFSFQAVKHITTADGGMLVVNYDDDRNRALRLRWFDIDRRHKARMNWKPWINRELTIDQHEVGYKYQMTDVAACFGLVGMRHLEEVLSKRRRLATAYRENLQGVQGLVLLDDCLHSSTTLSSHWLVGVLVDRREDFCRMLDDHSVETNMVQVRNDMFSVFGGTRLHYLENMNEIEDKYVYLPIHTQMEISDVEEICELIKKGW